MAVLPLYNTLLVPEASLYIKTDDYRSLTGKLPVQEEKVVVLAQKRKERREELSHDSFYPVGLAGQVTEVNEHGIVALRTRYRVSVNEVVVFPNHQVDVSVSRLPDVDDLDAEASAARLKALKGYLLKYSENFQWGGMARGYIAHWTSIEEIAAAMSPWLINGSEERYRVLEEDSRAARFDMLEKIIYENLELMQVNSEAKNAQEEDHQKLYRESALRKQIEYLQKELDAMHPEEVSDIRRLELAVEECGMNPEARKEADKVLNRLKQEGQNSPETGMLHDYLDYLTSLPWKKERPQEISIPEAAKVLDEDHSGLEKVKRRILQQIAVMSLKNRQSGSILLFVGAPGTGKTSIGQSIARALNRKYVRVSLGGVRDEADIRGHRRTYIGSMAGRIIDGIHKAGSTNPVMVLDEVDKLSASYNGDPASALLEVLDPEQNKTFTDHYLNVPYDLSDVFFICTANTLDTIPGPLLDRMEVIRFQGYTPIQKLDIAKKHLLPKSLKAAGLSGETLEIGDEVISEIISDYTREGGVRGLKKCLDALCRSAAVKLVSGDYGERKVPAEAGEKADGLVAEEMQAPASENGEAANEGSEKTVNEGSEKIAGETGQVETVKLHITSEMLRSLLDMPPMKHRKVPESSRPGVVTGLAWTAVGGEILYIETLFTKGSGKMIVTGQLGDVMKESVQIAVSLVKSIFPEKAKLFEENDLHVHVPDGATPKDGPSAGITLTTAIASLVTGIPVPPSVGMTGEVSLRGGVNPIGGLPEKLMAAQRAGVKKVFIPADNVDDLSDVSEEVKSALEIVPADRVRTVLEALGLELPHVVAAS